MASSLGGHPAPAPGSTKANATVRIVGGVPIATSATPHKFIPAVGPGSEGE